MTIFGIDPGYATVGFGVLTHDGIRARVLRYGAVCTPAGTPLPARLRTVYEDLGSLLDAYPADAVAVERLFFSNNTTTGIQVAQARGVILLCAAMRGIPVYEYTPVQVKQAVVGYGRADKRQVMELTRTLLGLSSLPRPDDAADALAVALCHAHSASSAAYTGHTGSVHTV